MDDYNFWQDLFDTYQSLSDWMKFAWLVMPPAFLLGLIALVMRHRVALKEMENGISGDLVYTVHSEDDGELLVYRHGRKIQQQPTLVLLGRPNSDRVEPQNLVGKL